ncbi:MAG TPA: PH domain-containing protein [Candidatus Avimonas sp.]|nr:PH domain-containing protein [Candidatus Avimonas sp.]
MIDFQNGTFFKLSPVPVGNVLSTLQPLLIEGEQLIASFKGIRDSVTFTNMRIIAVNVQGITGKKKDYTSLPYSKIQAYSIESAGVFDIDSELELYFSGLGKVRFEFVGNVDTAAISRIISQFVLK